MIITFLLYIFYQILQAIVGILPVGALNANVATSFDSLFEKLSIINSWISLSTLFVVIGIFFSTEIIILTIRTGIFFYNKLRGSG